MKRLVAKGSQVFVDLAVLSAAYWLAFLFRFEFTLEMSRVKLLFFTWPYVILFQYLVLVAFGVPSIAWRYVAIRDAVRILQATTLSVAVLAALRLTVGDSRNYARLVAIPLGVLAGDFALAFLGLTGVRVLRRIASERRNRDSTPREKPPRRTILVGAGQAGVLVAKEIANRSDLDIHPVGFVDDDTLKVGSVIYGIKVLGTTLDLPAICERTQATQALIAIANAPGRDIRRIRGLCHQVGIDTKIIPGVYEIVGGKVNLQRIRDVAIDDLLGRDVVALDEQLIRERIRARRVMVTGAGGSIGSELSRQICRFSPAELLLVEQAENSLFQIHTELAESAPDVPLLPCIADICDRVRMDRVFGDHRPETVFHAAAHKHVPMMEWNAGEAIKNNVIGTKTVADLADRYEVERFVLISTDKAVNPTSVMGVSKRVAEIYVQALSARSKTAYIAVRFGNVLGSAGSVVPLFRAQIARGGPVTVTHPDVQRYFMTIPEASQLVLQAGAMGAGGEIFVLDMGEPVKIVDLARDLIRLSGLEPDEEIEIRFTDLRPGEKLFEELSLKTEQAERTRHPKIFIGRLHSNEWDTVQQWMSDLRRLIDAEAGGDRIRQALRAIVPEYEPGNLKHSSHERRTG